MPKDVPRPIIGLLWGILIGAVIWLVIGFAVKWGIIDQP